MTLEEIKAAVDAGKTVYSGNPGYQVKKDKFGRYNIVCSFNGYTVGLAGKRGLNGKAEDFYVAGEKTSVATETA